MRFRMPDPWGLVSHKPPRPTLGIPPTLGNRATPLTCPARAPPADWQLHPGPDPHCGLGSAQPPLPGSQTARMPCFLVGESSPLQRKCSADLGLAKQATDLHEKGERGTRTPPSVSQQWGAMVRSAPHPRTVSRATSFEDPDSTPGVEHEAAAPLPNEPNAAPQTGAAGAAFGAADALVDRSTGQCACGTGSASLWCSF